MDNQNNSQVLKDKQALENFVDQLIKEKNSTYVTDANRIEVRTQLLSEVSDAINRKLVSLLSDEKVEELNKLLDEKATDEVVSKFFTDNIPTLQDAVTEAMIDFRKGYLSVVYPQENKQENDFQDITPAPIPTQKSN